MNFYNLGDEISNIDGRIDLYSLSKPDLVDLLRDKIIEKKLNPALHDLIDFSDSLHSYTNTQTGLSQRIIRKDGSDEFCHPTRINYRAVVRGCDEPLVIAANFLHDSIEHMVEYSHLNPYEAALKFQSHLQTSEFKAISKALNINELILFNSVLTLTRPFEFEEGKWIENKGNREYFRNIISPKNNISLIWNKIEQSNSSFIFSPSQLYAIPLVVKIGDKEDIIDKITREKVGKLSEFEGTERDNYFEKIKRNFSEGYLLLEWLDRLGLEYGPRGKFKTNGGEISLDFLHSSFYGLTHDLNGLENILYQIADERLSNRLEKIKTNATRQVNEWENSRS